MVFRDTSTKCHIVDTAFLTTEGNNFRPKCYSTEPNGIKFRPATAFIPNTVKLSVCIRKF